MNKDCNMNEIMGKTLHIKGDRENGSYHETFYQQVEEFYSVIYADFTLTSYAQLVTKLCTDAQDN